MDSIWEKGSKIPRFPRLKEDLKTDVLVIGGGMAGLLCAQNLARDGVDCTLIEASRLMGGVSGRTTAKLTSQHGLIYGKLLRRFGPERARLYWQANEDALAAFRSLAEEADCDFETKNHYIYTTGGIESLEGEMAAYEQLEIPAGWESNLPLPFPVTGALCFTNQAQFHPLRFAAHMAKGLRIYENTKALAFAGKQVQTPDGTITAERIIVATHFPMLNKHGAYFLKLYQQRSFVIALEKASQVDGMYLAAEENGLSLRNSGELLLVGGGGHRTGKPGQGWDMPEQFARKYCPDARQVGRWATQDCMSLDGMPYIGQYSRSTPGLYVATGFNKWGMTSSMMAAMVLADLVQGRENPYADLFSPSRGVLHRQLICNVAETTVNLLRPTKPRCPHLGCALKWNKQERSWDCPCHGSRFDENGRLLDNPATDDMKHPPQQNA